MNNFLDFNAFGKTVNKLKQNKNIDVKNSKFAANTIESAFNKMSISLDKMDGNITIYLSPSGNDLNSGLSRNAPIASFDRAIEISQNFKNITFNSLASGTYFWNNKNTYNFSDKNITFIGEMILLQKNQFNLSATFSNCNLKFFGNWAITKDSQIAAAISDMVRFYNCNISISEGSTLDISASQRSAFVDSVLNSVEGQLAFTTLDLNRSNFLMVNSTLCFYETTLKAYTAFMAKDSQIKLSQIHLKGIEYSEIESQETFFELSNSNFEVSKLSYEVALDEGFKTFCKAENSNLLLQADSWDACADAYTYDLTNFVIYNSVVNGMYWASKSLHSLVDELATAQIADASIGTQQLAVAAVSTDILQDEAVTITKLASDVTDEFSLLKSGKADASTYSINPASYPVWYSWEANNSSLASTHRLSGTYTLIEDMCFMNIQIPTADGWGINYYDLPKTALTQTSVMVWENNDPSLEPKNCSYYKIDIGYRTNPQTSVNKNVLAIRRFGSSNKTENLNGSTVSVSLYYRWK